MYHSTSPNFNQPHHIFSKMEAEEQLNQAHVHLPGPQNFHHLKFPEMKLKQ